MRKSNFCRLSVRELESKVVPTVHMATLAMHKQTIVSADVKEVTSLSLWTSDRQEVAHLTNVTFVPAPGSSSPFQNVLSFDLTADLDGNPKNGCEAVVATAVPSPSDVVGFNLSTPVWVHHKPLHLQVEAHLGWNLTGSRIGIQLAGASFTDPYGSPLPEDKVVLGGRPPTLHFLKPAMIYVIQQEQASTAIVHPGDVVNLLSFFVGEKEVLSDQMMFPVTKGSLKNATGYRAVHFNGLGVADQFISGKIVGGKVQITFAKDFARGNWKLQAVMVDAPAGAQLQFSMPRAGRDLITWDTSRHRLIRFRLNEVGGGQDQVSANDDWSTIFTVGVV